MRVFTVLINSSKQKKHLNLNTANIFRQNLNKLCCFIPFGLINTIACMFKLCRGGEIFSLFLIAFGELYLKNHQKMVFKTKDEGSKRRKQTSKVKREGRKEEQKTRREKKRRKGGRMDGRKVK